jgi:hypothetical protein
MIPVSDKLTKKLSRNIQYSVTMFLCFLNLPFFASPILTVRR